MAWVNLSEIIRDLCYPIGTYVYSNNSPANIIGGTWSQMAPGTFLCSAGSGYTLGTTGGSNTMQLSQLNIPSVFWSSNSTKPNAIQTLFDSGSNYGISSSPEETVGQAFNNMPKYKTSNLWYRIA